MRRRAGRAKGAELAEGSPEIGTLAYTRRVAAPGYVRAEVLVRVAIVGGGVGGHLVAHELQTELDVVLIEPRDHLPIPLAAPRVLVDPSVAERALVPYADFLPRVTHVQDRAIQVSSTGIETASGKRITADAIVLATGSAYPHDPLLLPPTPARQARLVEVATMADRIARADSVLIVGGGPVGVEVAGEVLSRWPDKALTLVHAGPALLPGTSPAPGRNARDWLVARGAEVILGDRVEPAPTSGAGPAAWRTRGGRTIDADLVLSFVGYAPRLDYLALDGAISESGRVRVRDTLQVHGHDTAFAVGDITDLNERKLAMYAAKHAKVVAANLRALAAGATPSATYRPATGDQTMLVTLGPNAGVGHLPLGPFKQGWLARWLKAGDMMVGKYRRRIGLSS